MKKITLAIPFVMLLSSPLLQAQGQSLDNEQLSSGQFSVAEGTQDISSERFYLSSVNWRLCRIDPSRCRLTE